LPARQAAAVTEKQHLDRGLCESRSTIGKGRAFDRTGGPNNSGDSNEIIAAKNSNGQRLIRNATLLQCPKAGHSRSSSRSHRKDGRASQAPTAVRFSKTGCRLASGTTADASCPAFVPGTHVFPCQVRDSLKTWMTGLVT